LDGPPQHLSIFFAQPRNETEPKDPSNMAAAIKALNAKIRSNKYTDYFCSTRMFYPFRSPKAAATALQVV